MSDAPESADTDVNDPGPAAPEGFRPPRKVLVGIVLALLVQVVVPLSYYWREDRYDERFAWRMFSGIRLQSCQTRVTVERGAAAEPLRLSKHLHEAWIGHLRRNRRAVIGAFLEERCRLHEDLTGVTLENRCRSATGETRFASQRYRRDCRAGQTEWPEPVPIVEESPSTRGGAR